MGYFSNGTEGNCFEERWCSRCHHDAAYRAYVADGEKGPRPEPCPVWNAHLLFSYDLCNKKDDPGKVVLDMLIERTDLVNRCVMFVPADAISKPRLAQIALEEAGQLSMVET